MKTLQGIAVAGLLAAFAVTGFAQSQPLHIYNRLRVGYDDNIYSAEKDETGSLRLVEEIQLKLNLALERLYLGIDYRPSLLWEPERDSDKTDFLNDLTANLSYSLTPQLVLSVKDTLRASQLPELENDGYRVRDDDDNWNNNVIGTLAWNVLPQTRIDLSGRYMIFEYNKDEREYDNYRIAVGGLSLRQQLASHSTVFADFRYQTLTYPDAEDEYCRDADSVFAGLGLEQTFSDQLIGMLRGGFQHRTYDSDRFDDSNSPYVDASVTFMPSPDTRFTLSGGYSVSESDIGAYASQDRFACALNFAHDFSNKLTLYAGGSLALGKYEADYSFDPAATDDDETTYSANARLSYKILQNNWLELGYTFTKLDSDVVGRTSYDRNRVDLGWKIQLF